MRRLKRIRSNGDVSEFLDQVLGDTDKRPAPWGRPPVGGSPWFGPAMNETPRPVRFLIWGKAANEADWRRLEAADRLAIDTESDPFHRYFEKVCLIQISTDDADYLYDPLEVGLAEPLRALLSEPRRTLVLHGADYDVRTLKQSFSLTLGTLFDTALAAQFLGKSNTGLKSLLESELQIEIDKGEQRSDWGRRPLTDAQISYARQDTRYLLALAAHLQSELEDLGRLSWLTEECELLRHRMPVEKTFDPETWRKVKRASELSAAGRRALRAAYIWREEAAQEADKPPFRIARNDQLFRLARAIDSRGPRVLARLKQLEFLPKDIDRAALGHAIAEGLGGPDPGERRRPSPSGTPRVPHSPESKERLARLRAARATWAEQLGLDPGFLVSSALLDQVARDAPESLNQLANVTGMTSWRIEAVGSKIMEALRL